MTALLRQAWQRIARLSEPEQDRVARVLLALPEIERADAPVPFTALRGAGAQKTFQTADEVDRYIRRLRDEWPS